MLYFQSLTQDELKELLLPLDPKKARYRAQQIFNWVYKRFETDWDKMSNLSQELRLWLKKHIEIFSLSEEKSQIALDGTYKVLWKLHDSKTIESVMIPVTGKKKKPIAGRLTACISSQVGCAMACHFCLTGIQGLDRNLQVHEIVSQVYELRKKAPITNIVFMGMGEPLHNFENLVKACTIFLDPAGLHFSRRKITISTSGIVPAIEKLGEKVNVSLAVSLNATTDEQRSKIMPINKKWNIQKLLDACRNYPLGKHRRITFEYVLLKDINDSLQDAERLKQLIHGIPCKINLIPFNEHPGSDFKRPDAKVISDFQDTLIRSKITATIRISRGHDILAACGQLRSIFGTARGTEKHKDWQKPSFTKV